MTRAIALLILLLGCESPLPRDGGVSEADAGPVLWPCLEVTPSSLDFGEVELTFPPVQKFRVMNKTSVARLVHARAPTGPSFLSLFDQGDLLTQAGETHSIDIRFFPTDARLHLGVLELTGGENCDATVALRGLGAGSVSFERDVVDFGFVVPGQEKTLEVRLDNTRRAPAQVTELQLDGLEPATFQVDLPAVPFELPAMSSRTFTITARPPGDSFYEARLFVSTQFGFENTVLRVAGGAPVVEVPAVIEVALAPFEPWFVPPPSVRRSIRIRNASTATPSPATQLELVPPVASVELADGGMIGVSAHGSLREVEFMPQFSAVGPGESGELLLRITPNAVGLRSYRIHLFTNDPANPETFVTLNVNSATLGRCFMRVEPRTDVNLSRVSFNRSRGTVSFINEGPNRCVVDDSRIDTTPYTIVDAAPQLIVEPWQTGTLTIEGPSPGLAGTGTLSFRVLNSEGQPEMLLLHVP